MGLRADVPPLICDESIGTRKGKGSHVMQIDVLVAAASHDLKADGIAAAVAARNDMTLAANRVLTVREADTLLRAIPQSLPCALVIVGLHSDTEAVAENWLSQRHKLVVLRVDVVEDLLLMAARDVSLDAVLIALQALVAAVTDQSAQFRWHMH